jgi:GMP synthase (glutamine-hydrolysing)
LQDLAPHGIIITGSGEYVNAVGAPRVAQEVIEGQLAPVLGICYGMQLMATQLGGSVGKMKLPEHKWHNVVLNEQGKNSHLFPDFIEEEVPAWMAHNCMVAKVPPDFIVTGSTEKTPVACFEDRVRELYGVQWHPDHIGSDPSSQAGTIILTNFLRNLCGYVEP